MFLGLKEQYPRSTILMTMYFCLVEIARKNTNLMSSPVGQFFVSGGAALTGFLFIWPLEVLKNLAQAETKGMGDTSMARAQYIFKT